MKITNTRNCTDGFYAVIVNTKELNIKQGDDVIVKGCGCDSIIFTAAYIDVRQQVTEVILSPNAVARRCVSSGGYMKRYKGF